MFAPNPKRKPIRLLCSRHELSPRLRNPDQRDGHARAPGGLEPRLGQEAHGDDPRRRHGLPALPLRILQWARQRRFHLKITELGADETFEAAAEEEPSLEVERASLNEVADSGRKFHYVMGSLCLRRVPPERLEDTLSLCDKIAIKGLVFSDLRKSAAYPGRGAFTAEELEIAADRAGLRYLRARRCALFGMSLAGEKY
ncbi:MAG: hypothetical protein M0D55_15440 [Elusimicrobiota bacterium]|nr:MAG: hypothetical protein M0D55_15440 [Elusimicrobiota bacterium]